MRRRKRYTPGVPYEKIPYPDRDLRVDKFATWNEFLDYCNGETRLTEYPRQSQDDNNSRFTDATSYEQMQKYAREGWPKGMKIAAPLTVGNVSTIGEIIEKFDPYYDRESGGVLDVARFLDGEPECWIKLETVTTAGSGIKHLTIVFNGTASSGISTNVMILKGAAVASLIETLEYAGHRCRVILAYGMSGSGPGQEVYIGIKEFDQTLDLDRLVTAMAHPSTLRRLMFAYMERMDDVMLQSIGVGRGYGHPEEVKERGDIYIGKSGNWEDHWATPETAKEWIIKTLEEQGVKITKAI